MKRNLTIRLMTWDSPEIVVSQNDSVTLHINHNTEPFLHISH